MHPARTLLLIACLLLPACSAPAEVQPASPVPTASPAPAATSSPTPAQAGWCTPPGGLNGDFLVIGYLPDYRSLEPTWGNCLTDLIYFSAEPLADGNLDTSRLDPATLQRMQEMKITYGTRLHVSLGGYGRSEGFAPMVTDEAARQKFIDQLLAFARANALDGIDFDWEFPENQAELDGYLALMRAVKEAGLIVSVAIYPYPDLDLTPYLGVDRIYLMSYDRGPRHSTLEQATADLDYLLQFGFSRRQLILGVPFYGRLTASPYTAYSYSEIIATYAPSPDLDEVGGIYFNGIQTMQAKVCYAEQNGFGGVMIWELGQDSADDTSLLRAIYAPLAQGCPP